MGFVLRLMVSPQARGKFGEWQDVICSFKNIPPGCLEENRLREATAAGARVEAGGQRDLHAGLGDKQVTGLEKRSGRQS